MNANAVMLSMMVVWSVMNAVIRIATLMTLNGLACVIAVVYPLIPMNALIAEKNQLTPDILPAIAVVVFLMNPLYWENNFPSLLKNRLR